MSNKSKGSNAERELYQMFIENSFRAVRVAGSGVMENADCDLIAGKKGYEIIIKFLKQAKSHLEKDGKIFLLISSLSKPGIIKKESRELGYKIKLLNKKHLFFEELFVYEIRKKAF